ncbi:carbohydrate ABC transporter substrate-binding protein [Paenibacillus mesophilus]|uniref:ABC transporter substrate-binding protein n=1 Tax=Paenibacillus mesophilus TaxID=2582849 RepID=UPI00110D6F3B|nr:ABC transporter substrate-binding protein [Paenibacillus mesophilus]TMV45938.1 carbohydrate ABC transporter substrate-binding protein [Paenibacillus mesophilus]
MSKRRNSFMLGCVMISSIGLLAACGGSKSGEEELKTPAVPQEPTEVYFLSTSTYWWDEATFMKEFGEPLQKKYPHIIPKTIKPTGMNTKVIEGFIAAKQPIDVILAANASYLLYLKPYEFSSDIEPFIKQYKIDLNRFAPEFIDMNRKLGEGKLIGLPLQDSPTQILYNKGIFDKFGVPYPPHDQWTWDEMFALANKVTRMDGGTQYYGVRMHSTFFRRNPYSLEYVDPKTNKAIFNNDIGKKVSEMYLRQYEKSDTPGLAPDGAKMFFEDRTLAMWMGLGASYNTPERYKGMDWDMAPIPVLPERGPVSVQPYPDYMYLSSTSKHKELAVQAMEFFTSDSFQMERSKNAYTTPLKSSQIKAAFGQNAEMFRGKNISAMSPKKYAPAATYDQYTNQAAATIIPKHVHNVRDGKTDINSALRQAEEEVNKYIEDNRK